MNIDRMTQKAQEALGEAQKVALRLGHQEIDGEHLLMALIEQEGGLVSGLLGKMEVPVAQFKARLEDELGKKPSVSGGSTEAGKVYVTQRLNALLVKAGDEAKRLKDE